MTASLDEHGNAISSVDMIRARALGCPGVAGMSAVTRSYLPGRTVTGVTMDEQRVDVHVIAQYGTPLPGITERLGTLLLPILAGRSLHVHIDDIVLPGETVPADESQLAPANPGAVGVGG
jgi:uncharacterized alkaline shock family protein YloU